MKFKSEFWTYMIVTAVTMVIWFYVAGQTREEQPVQLQLGFQVAGVASEGEWEVLPLTKLVTVLVEGSPFAIRQASLYRKVIMLDVPAAPGVTTVELLPLLHENSELENLGVIVESVEPAEMDIDVKKFQFFTAEVRGVVPGLPPEAVKVEPSSIKVRMPIRQQRTLPQVYVEAFVDPASIHQLKPAREHTVETTLRWPADLPVETPVDLGDTNVKATFTVESRTREAKLETVLVQLAGPPKDYGEYKITLSPPVLRNVTVSGDEDLIQRIEDKEVTVVAVLQLSNREKEQGIDRKAITLFLALNEDWSESIPVQCRVDGSDTPAEIGLTITAAQ